MKLLPKWDIYYEGNYPKGIHTTDQTTIINLVNNTFKSKSELAERLEDLICEQFIKREIIVGTFSHEPNEKEISEAIIRGKEEYEYDNILEIKSVFRQRTDEEISELFYSGEGEEEVTDTEYNVSVVSLMKPPIVEEDYDFDEDLVDTDIDLGDIPNYEDEEEEFGDVSFAEEELTTFSTEY